MASDPKFAAAYYNLGKALSDLGRWDEAEPALRTSTELDPQFAPAYDYLGLALNAQKRGAEAVQAIRQAVALDPRSAHARVNLGGVLLDEGQDAEAAAAFRAGIDRNPKVAQAHGGLGLALLRLGDPAGARAATARCLELLPEGHPMRPMAEQQRRRCERAVALEGRLPELLSGEREPEDADLLELAELCRSPARKHYAAAARFYAAAFAHHPKALADLAAGYRARAARAAALGGAGRGEDDPPPDEAARAALRQQARAWLRADLDAHARFVSVKTEKLRRTIRQRLEHWRRDPDLAGIRDADALARLSAAERAACRDLWDRVEKLLRQVGEP